jgi:hypothetical protein
MRRIVIVKAAAIISALIIPAIATPASAVGWEIGCNATGSKGQANFNWDDKYTLDPLTLYVKDTSADGHHVGVRLVTQFDNGDIKDWVWHEYYGGSDGTASWDTTAYSSYGIKYATVQVATMEGDDIVHLCTASPAAERNI